MLRDEQKREVVFKLFAEGHTYAYIAKVVGVSRQRVQQLIKPPIRILNLLRKRSHNKCEHCELPLRLGDGHVHHLTGHADFNRLANLEYLCRSCHRKADAKIRELKS